MIFHTLDILKHMQRITLTAIVNYMFYPILPIEDN